MRPSPVRSVFKFSEFDPSVTKPDYRAIALRWMFICALVLVPLILAALRYLHAAAPAVLYFMGAVAALYVPPLVTLVRRPRVVVGKSFEVTLRNPKTVDTRILVNAACSAAAYFGLLAFAIFIVGGRLS